MIATLALIASIPGCTLASIQLWQMLRNRNKE